jgi:hypothetical protein
MACTDSGTSDLAQTAARFDGLKAAAAFAVLLALAGAGLYLYLFNPSTEGIYPVCFFHRLTGLECPGCGSLRAIHQLLHGHLLLAFRFNPLLIASLPLLGLWSARGMAALLLRAPGAFAVQPRWLCIYAVATVVFGIVRNFPIAFLHPFPPGS